MEKFSIKKFVAVIVFAAAVVLGVGVFMLYMQNRLALNNTKNDLKEEIVQVTDLVSGLDDEVATAKSNFDDSYYSKARTMVYMIQKDADFTMDDASMTQFVDLFKVDNVLVLDKNGAIVAKAVEAAVDYSSSRFNQLRTVFDTGEPSEAFSVDVNGKRMRYYGAKLSDDTMIVLARDPAELNNTIANSTSLESVLKNVSVGINGYAFAVSHLDYTFSYYPDEKLQGADALSAGVPIENLEEGFSGWMTVNDQRLFCQVSLVDNNYIICAIPEKEITQSRTTVVLLTMAIFIALIVLLVGYAAMIKKEQVRREAHTEDVLMKVGGLHINYPMMKKLFALMCVCVVALFGASIYMQTLYTMTVRSNGNEKNLDSIEQTIANYKTEVSDLKTQYNNEYLDKCQALATVVSNNPEVETKADLTELADILGVKHIWILDAAGNTVATDSNYWDFKVSDDPEEQSYEFNDLVKGYVDYFVQDAMVDEKGNMNQYIGVNIRDDQGMTSQVAQICVSPEKLDAVMQDTKIDSILSNIKIGAKGFAFAVNKKDNTFAYYPNDKMVGQDVHNYGMTDFSLKDGFSDFLTFEQQKYYCSSTETDNYYIYSAIPKTEMNRSCVPLSLISALAGLVCMLILLLIITSEKAPEEVVSEDEPEQTVETKVENAKTSDGKAVTAEDGKKKEEPVIEVNLADGRKTSSMTAASRWSNVRIAWDEKTAEQRLSSLLGGIIEVLAILLLIVILRRNSLFEKNSIINYIANGEWERNLNIFSITAAVTVIVIANTISAIVRKLLMVFARTFGARGETVCRLMDNLIKYATIFGVLYYALAMFGVDTATLVASAGILSLVIGLGAKDLITDIIAGLFIVFEGEFRVGDIVMIGDYRGTVKEIGIRTTKVQDGSNNVKIMNNSAVTGVLNMTKHFSYCWCDVGIDYGESLEHVESVLQSEFPRIKRHLPAITDGPFYKGVVELGDNAVTIRIMVQCAESDRIQLGRDLNREVKIIFDRHNINIPFPQIVLNQPVEYKEASTIEKRKADAFVNEQKELSKDIPHVEN